MKKLFCLIFIILFMAHKALYANLSRAVVCVPITDLIGHPLTHATYEALPLCGILPTQAASCPRLHQLLFNEQVTVVNSESPIEGNIQVQVPHLFFITNDINKPQQTYWMRADHILFLDELEKKGINYSHVPPPIKINNPQSLEQKKVVTLCRPFYDQQTDQTYSVGTRFVKAGPATYKGQKVYLLDGKKNTMTTVMLPKSAYIDCAKDIHEKKKQFVQLIQQWAHPKKGFIPYVFGGCSITHTSNATLFKTNESPTLATYAELPDFKHTPKPGIDCSGLVARAAQLCGIAYFYKNTLTLAQYLPPLSKTQKLEAGDLIWIPGHVMVVTDLKNNLMVEARSYAHEFGKVHEIALDNVFLGIKTYDNLVAAFHQKTPLKRLDKSGTIRETFKEFKLLKLV